MNGRSMRHRTRAWAARIYPARVSHSSWLVDVSTSYDRVADRYAELVRAGLDGLPLESAFIDHFARRVIEAGSGPVLDLGCGPGWLTQDLASKGLQPVGVDIATNMLRRAREHSADLGFATATLTRLPFADGAAQGIFCWYVLHHVPDDELEVVLRETARVTAPGGHLLLGGHVGDSSYSKIEGYGGLPMRVLFARRSPDAYAACFAMPAWSWTRPSPLALIRLPLQPYGSHTSVPDSRASVRCT